MSKKNRLIYLPLGGAGEIGMNMYVYGYGPAGKEEYILVDAGVTFPDMDGTPGVDLIMADASWIIERADRLAAIFITHAHEDHVGALGLLWPQLQAPVYSRKFTAAIASNKMERAGVDAANVKTVGPLPHMVEAGPFRVGFLPLSHSIPEASGLVIDTPAGRIVHTGDFKCDPSPLVGEPFDPEAMREVAKPGVLALVCDSTNVFSPHAGRSETSLREPITELMATASGLVVATTFASNVARLKTLAEGAKAAGRSVVVLGRAMRTMIQTGVETGVLKDFPAVVDIDLANDMPRGKVMVLATGSQGERRAASAQLAGDGYMGLSLKPDDTFLFSSKTIPGNETGVARIWNALAEKGVNVVADDDRYHVSGHANRPDLLEMQALINPQIVVPMHGEYRHLRKHAELSDENGRKTIIAPNGSLVDLSAEHPKVVEHIETGRTYLDGSLLINALDGIVRERMHMALRGHVIVNVMLDDSGEVLDAPWAETLGVPAPKGDFEALSAAIEEGVAAELARAKNRDLDKDSKVEELVKRAVNKVCKAEAGKKPVCTVLINRMEYE